MAETARNIEPEEMKADSLVVKSQAKIEEFKGRVAELVTIKPDNTFLVTITTKDQYTLADTVRKMVESERKIVLADIEPLVSDAHALHRKLTAKRDAALLPYDNLRKALVAGGDAYIKEEERKAEEAAAELREKARKEEEARRIREAAELEAENRVEEAEEIISAPITHVAQAPKPDLPKVDKRVYRPTTYKVRVRDMRAFYQYVAQRPDLYDLITINEAALNRKAKALGKAFSMQGCEVYEA